MSDRPDIEQARKLMSTKFGGGREMKKLVDHLWDDEQVERLATGKYGSTLGLVALTDRRVLFISEGMMKKTIEDFPLDKISSVQWSSSMLLGTINLFASGNKAEISNVNKADGKAMTDLIRARAMGPGASSAPAPPMPPPAAAPADLADQLTKLAALRDSGVLTEEEFAAQKAKLLG